MCRKQRITSPKRDLSSLKPIGRRLYETENSGGNWTRRRREGRGEKLSGENPLRDHSSYNHRIEGSLAEKRKAPSTGRIALILEKMVEQMGVEPTTYTMRTYRSSQLSYCPTKNVSVNIHRNRKKSSPVPLFFGKRLLLRDHHCQVSKKEKIDVTNAENGKKEMRPREKVFHNLL